MVLNLYSSDNYLMKKICLLSLLSLILTSCILDSSTIVVDFKNKPETNATGLNFSLANVQLINNQFVFTGLNLDNVTAIKLKEGATEINLSVESKNSTQIIANSLSNINLAAEKVFDFILSNASAASTFTVDFNLCNSVLAGKAVDCTVTPVDKDNLTYNNTSGKWAATAPSWTTATTNVYRLVGYVGIGTATPGAPLSVLGDYTSLSVRSIQSNSDVVSIEGQTNPSLALLTYGGGNDRFNIKFKSYDNNPQLVDISSISSVQTNNNVGAHAGYLSFSTTSAAVLNERMRISELGKVGIGVVTPSEMLEVAGNIKATAILFSSDKNLKKNISPIGSTAEKILGLSGVEYKWRRDEYPERNFDSKTHYGFIAQEVAKIFPDLVRGEEGNLAVDYVGLIAPMVEVIKSQDKKVKSLGEEVERLKIVNNKQRALLEKLAARVEKLESK